MIGDGFGRSEERSSSRACQAVRNQVRCAAPPPQQKSCLSAAGHHERRQRRRCSARQPVCPPRPRATHASPRFVIVMAERQVLAPSFPYLWPACRGAHPEVPQPSPPSPPKPISHIHVASPFLPPRLRKSCCAPAPAALSAGSRRLPGCGLARPDFSVPALHGISAFPHHRHLAITTTTTTSTTTDNPPSSTISHPPSALFSSLALFKPWNAPSYSRTVLSPSPPLAPNSTPLACRRINPLARTSFNKTLLCITSIVLS